jgi:hypothetical protein
MENKITRGNYLTKIIKVPQRKIFTFGDTSFDYLVVSGVNEKSILRKGSLNCSKPTILTAERLMKLFEGFSEDAIQFAEEKYANILSKLRGLGYQFQNNLKQKEEYSLTIEEVIQNILKEQTSEEKNVALVSAPNDIWNVGLVKVSFEIIGNSFSGNMQDLEDRGYFQTTEEKQKIEIETLFQEASENRSYIDELARKLQEYGMFEEYEARFFALVRK